jgi:hypothetical protein
MDLYKLFATIFLIISGCLNVYALVFVLPSYRGEADFWKKKFRDEQYWNRHNKINEQDDRPE